MKTDLALCLDLYLKPLGGALSLRAVVLAPYVREEVPTCVALMCLTHLLRSLLFLRPLYEGIGLLERLRDWNVAQGGHVVRLSTSTLFPAQGRSHCGMPIWVSSVRRWRGA